MNNKQLFDEQDENLIDIKNTIDTDEFASLTDADTNSNDGMEFQQFGKFGLNEDWVIKYNTEIRQSHESYEIKLLHEDLYEIFKGSDFYDKYIKIKKVPKQDVLKIFLYFSDNLSNGMRYTNVEKFLEIADFMNINYEVLYKELPMMYKQNLLAELDNQYHLFEKRKVHKLF